MPDPDYNELLNEELNMVYRYLRKSNISHEDAQDLVQETAYKYLLYSDAIKPKYTRSWLIRVALNSHHDAYRKHKRISVGLDPDQLQLLSEDLPDEIVLNKEKRQDIEHVLSKLKPHYREMLLFKYQWNMKYEEIAQVLELTQGTVKTSLFRARKQFTKLYRRLPHE